MIKDPKGSSSLFTQVPSHLKSSFFLGNALGHHTEHNTRVPQHPSPRPGTGLGVCPWCLGHPWCVLSATLTVTTQWKKLKHRNEETEVGWELGERPGRPTRLFHYLNQTLRNLKGSWASQSQPTQLAQEGAKVQLGWGRCIQEASLALHTAGHSLQQQSVAYSFQHVLPLASGSHCYP